MVAEILWVIHGRLHIQAAVQDRFVAKLLAAQVRSMGVSWLVGTLRYVGPRKQIQITRVFYIDTLVVQAETQPVQVHPIRVLGRLDRGVCVPMGEGLELALTQIRHAKRRAEIAQLALRHAPLGAGKHGQIRDAFLVWFVAA